jgi:hypothetical protein
MLAGPKIVSLARTKNNTVFTKKALNPYEKKIWLMGRDGETNPNFQSWYSNVVVVFSLK